MKVFFKSLFVLAAIMTFAACEDVPAPYAQPGTEEEGGETPGTELTQGDGTVDSPYNAAAVNAYIATLPADTESEGNVYIKGIISTIKENSTAQYGNASFYISDDGKASSEQFYVYRCYNLDNKKFTTDNALNVGDEVVICGKVVNYKGNTAETVQNKAYIYSLNGNGGNGDGDDQPVVTGDNLLANGDFETWEGGQPTNWKSVSSAGNATLTQSTDAHGGSYSVAVVGTTSNKRLAYKELTLKAGTYTFSFYAKATESDKCQCRPGYVPVNGGTVGDYAYGSYEAVKVGAWTQISHTFTLEAQTTVCLVVMNPKGGTDYQDTQDILIDDATLMTANGGVLDDGDGDNPNPPTGDVQHITIADFLAKADPNTTYELTGVVRNIVNTQYGNFDLEDETGSVFIYGLLDLQGNAKNFENIGITEGDEVTLTGAYKDYNGKAEIANAQLISFKKGEGGNQGGNDDSNVEPTGDNLLGNGDFETWSGNLPVNWKSACTASSATLMQSTDAHGGSYSVAVVGASSNKRLGYKELDLAAGSYTFTFYAKATTSDKCQCRPGYVPVTDGSVGSYAYGDYVGIKVGEWTQVKHTFTLDAPATVCLVVMNPKGGTDYQDTQDILIDDACLVKE